MNRQKHKLSRRILAVLLMAAMLITMLPSAMFAQDGQAEGQTPVAVNNGSGEGTTFVTNEKNGVTVNKYVTGNQEDGYQLKLEAYAQETLTASSTPLDVVLVLDTSGSMADYQDKVYAKDLDIGKTYYYATEDFFGTTWHEVFYKEGGIFQDSGWYYKGTFGNTKVDPKESPQDHGDQLYAAPNKMDAMKQAVNGFIDDLASSEGAANANVAIVSFAGDASEEQKLTNVATGAETLKAVVNGLHANGATRADEGIAKANEILGNESESNKVVIMFTDGEPTSGSSFEDKVANNAISTAKDMKKNGVDIYTVGVFEEANPSDTNGKFNSYMNGVSSNYPYAENYNNLGWGSTDKGYYMAADNAASLNQVFADIADKVTSSLKANPDTSAVLSDTLSSYFNFAASVEDETDITVEYVPATGVDQGEFSFGNSATMPQGSNPQVTIDKEAGTITVTGFDYKTNAIAVKDGTIEKGGKLVVTIPIELDETACLASDETVVPTNATDEGNRANLFYKGSEATTDNDTYTDLTESPTVTIDKSQMDANGTDVTVQVFVDGKEITNNEELAKIVELSRPNGDYDYFQQVKFDETTGIMTYDFDIEQYDCVDIQVNVVDDEYILQGVESYQIKGENGTKNVTDSYKIDNVASDGDGNTVDCKIYLRSKYSVQYTENGNDNLEESYKDSNVYVIEDVTETTPTTDYPTDNENAKLMKWQNDEKYETTIALKSLPTVEAGYTVDGWFIGENNAEYDPASAEYKDGVAVSAVVGNANKDNIITFNATTEKSVPDTPTDEQIQGALGNAVVAVECDNDKATAHEAPGQIVYELKHGYTSLSTEVEGDEESGYTYRIQINELEKYVTENYSTDTKVSHTKVTPEENTAEITLTYNEENKAWEATVPEDKAALVTVTAMCENHDISSIEKSVVTSEQAAKEAGITDTSKYTFPADKKLAFTEGEKESVTLLYKVTVTGNENTTFTLTDENSIFVKPEGEGSVTATIPDGKTSVDCYVEKTFDLTDFGVGNHKLTNTVTVSNTQGNVPTDPTADADVDIEITPKAPEFSDVVEEGDIQVKCTTNHKETVGEFGLIENGSKDPVKVDAYTYTIELIPGAYVDAYDDFVKFDGHQLTDPNVAYSLKVEYKEGKWDVVSPVVIPVKCANVIDGITKTVVTDAEDIAAAVGDKLDSYTFPVDNKVTVKEGRDVTLVYKITVKGTPQTNFIVKDTDAELLPAGKDGNINNGVTETNEGFEGTIGADGFTSFYVTRTFTDLQVDSEPLKNVAQAYLPGEKEPEKTDDATVDVTVEPNLDITGFTKSVVDETEANAAAVAETGDYDYPVDDVVTVHDGKANILFKIEITGNAGTEFGLTDNGAKIVKWENADIEEPTAEQAAQGEYRGKLSANGDDPITAVIYVSKEYDNLDLGKNDETNIATIMNISDPESVPDDGKTSADVTIDYIPELPSDEEIIELLGGDAVKVTCTNEDVKHDAKQYKLWADTFTQDENFTVSEDGTYTFNVKVNPEEYVKAFIGETFINNDQDKGNVDHWIDKEQTQQDQITLIYDAKNGKWKVDANTVPAQFYVLCAGDPTYDIQFFTKTVITENDKDTLPEELQNRTDYVVPAVKEDGTIETVTVPAGDTVTLLYAIKVEGAERTQFTVKDTGADLAYTANDVTEDTATDTFTGTIDKTGSVLFYVTRTFAFDDVKDGKLVNKATITAGDNTTINPDEVTEEEEVPAEQAMKVTPVDMTIYMGGNDGYEAVVNNSGKEMATTSLPEPLFLIESGQDGFDPTKLSFTNATQNKSWTVTKVGETADRTRGIYRLSGAAGQDPVRVQYTDANGTAVTSDTFEPTNELYATYDVEMYYGGNNPDDIVAKYDNDEYAVVTTAGTLTVRGVDNTEAVYVHQDTLPTEELAENVEAAVTATAGTEFALNDTTVPVEEEGVGLLFDGIIDDATHDRTGALEKEVDEERGAVADNETRHYDAKYLDLVDTNNGNAWVKTANGEQVTVTWDYPEGTDENTEFTVYHFEGLHRDGENSGFNLEDVTKVEIVEKELSFNDAGISFNIDSGDFSPYVLVWETENGSDTPDYPDYPIWTPDGDDDGPSGLNTEDHFSYVVGYAEDYRTGEATDNEDLWPVKPNNQITRAEVATIFYRLLEDEVRDEYDTTTNDFSDVTADSWYNQTVSTLARMGIVKGYEDGSFRPNAPITRAEFGAIATRFFAETGATYEPGTFTDVTGNEWFANAIQDAVNLGLIGGYPDGTVRPNNNITRAEACAIVNRTLGRVPDADHLLPEDVMKVWPDNNPTDWFYADMQEATNGHEYAWIEEDGHEIEEWTNLLDKDWTDR